MSSATENTEDQGGWLEVEVNCNGESESESNSDPESGSESGSSFGSESNEASSGSDSECEGGDSDFGVDDQIDVDSDFDNHFDVEDSDVAGVKVIAVTKIMKDSEEGHSHNNIEEADRFFQSGTGTDCLAEDWNCHDTELGNISNAGQSQDEYVGHQVGHMHIEILGQPKMGKSALQKTLVKVLSSSSRGWGDCCDGFGVDCANTNIDELVALQHPNSVSCIIFSRNETGSENVTVNNEPAVGVNAKSNRNQNSLNCCIYALPPHHMSALDEAHLTAIAENGHFDVVLPVICKAETMSIDERKQYSEDLKAFFESQEKLDQLITSEPVAVVCEERHYTWGSVSPLDPRVSQIDKLCDYLESHIQLKRKVIRDNAPCKLT
uniref:Septin-type G domain-containing protein n=1 Tax=Aplanochytrium stocchinoi TaxID=215587 RepID=A0A7S3PFY5_9STRA|mmetsp:Transcript_6052/g.7277  ORF Transcript_6052/g.7277 Transcript_6052/m.7277 type:complete len:379 (-) Transcript_6052:926-2062(-)